MNLAIYINVCILLYYYRIRHTEDRQMKIASSTLTIENVKRNHSSYYICKAANKYGIDEAVIHLVIQGKANCSFNSIIY